MGISTSTNVKFDQISSFEFNISSTELLPLESRDSMTTHNHMECEIYIHLAGDVTFWVENNIYPLSYGDVIISRPHEKHHIVFQSDNMVGHYWILFSCDGNEELFDVYFKRKLGENNLICPTPQAKEVLISCCEELRTKKLTLLEKYFNFFKIIDILTNSKTKNFTPVTIPPILTSAMNYISSNLSEQISIDELALKNHVSITTLERNFKQYLGLTPSKYILNQRLSLAETLLRGGKSVSDTAMSCGFSDVSSFIQNFKKIFGMTPLKYSRYSSKR